MTVIAVAADDVHVAIAADREWSDGTLRFSKRKLVPVMVGDKQVGAVASTGDARIGVMLEERLSGAVRAQDPRETLLDALQGAVDTFRADHKELAPAHDHNGDCEAEALLLVHGRAFRVDEGWSVIEIDFTDGGLGMCSLGEGSGVALGALWVLRDDGYSAEDQARHACEAAADLVSSCGLPVDVVVAPRARP